MKLFKHETSDISCCISVIWYTVQSYAGPTAADLMFCCCKSYWGDMKDVLFLCIPELLLKTAGDSTCPPMDCGHQSAADPVVADVVPLHRLQLYAPMLCTFSEGATHGRDLKQWQSCAWTPQKHNVTGEIIFMPSSPMVSPSMICTPLVIPLLRPVLFPTYSLFFRWYLWSCPLNQYSAVGVLGIHALFVTCLWRLCSLQNSLRVFPCLLFSYNVHMHFL